MREHPVQQEIHYIVVVPYDAATQNGETYYVGSDGVTRIEACTKSGMHADIPYVRVWRGDVALAEFCQHNIHGVFFKEARQ